MLFDDDGKLYIPVSNFLVYPYVGYVPEMPNFIIQKSEVDYLICIEIDKLKNLPIKKTNRIYKGTQLIIPYFDINNEMIWGATSMILNEFIALLKRIDLYPY